MSPDTDPDEAGQLDHVQDGDDIRIPQSALIAYVISNEGRGERPAATIQTRAA